MDMLRSLKWVQVDAIDQFSLSFIFFARRIESGRHHLRISCARRCRSLYRGTSLTRHCATLGHYGKTVPSALWWSYGETAVSVKRGTPVL